MSQQLSPGQGYFPRVCDLPFLLLIFFATISTGFGRSEKASNVNNSVQHCYCNGRMVPKILGLDLYRRDFFTFACTEILHWMPSSRKMSLETVLLRLFVSSTVGLSRANSLHDIGGGLGQGQCFGLYGPSH